MTNKEKVSEIQDKAKKIKENYLNEVFKGVIPSGKIYEVSYRGKNGAEITEKEIDEIWYSTGIYPQKEFKKCTKEILLEWEEELKELDSLKKENIYIGYVCYTSNSKCSGAFKYSELGKKYVFNKLDLEEEVERYNSIYIAKENQFNCDHCGKAADNDKKVNCKIFYRNNGLKTRIGEFCSGKCASWEQMGCEG